MITTLAGTLHRIHEDRCEMSVGPLRVELLIPAADVEELGAKIGQDIELFTVFYLEGDASGGNLTPRLIGFLREQDRGFYNAFVTVKGIGPKKALRALTVPAAEVAAAIELKDVKALTKLPQVGKRAAEQIVATLAGKVGVYAGDAVIESPGNVAVKLSSDEEDAVSTLVALGERRGDAEAVLERVKSAEPEVLAKGPDAIVQAMLRLRSARR